MKRNKKQEEQLSQQEERQTYEDLQFLEKSLRDELENARIAAQKENPDFKNHSEFWYKWSMLHAKLNGYKTYDKKPITETIEELVTELKRIATAEMPTQADSASTDKMN